MPPKILDPNNPSDIRRVTLSAGECQSGVTSNNSIEVCLEALHETGFVIIENGIPADRDGHDLVNELRNKIVDDYNALATAPGVHFNIGDSPSVISQTPPLTTEFFQRRIYSNRNLMDVLEFLLGPYPKLGYMTCQLSLPDAGGNRQAVHADAYTDILNFPYAMAVSIYLNEVGPGTGSPEIWPGTHIYDETRMVDTGRGWIDADILDHRGGVCPPVEPIIPKGGICVRDLRTWYEQDPRFITDGTNSPNEIHNSVHLKIKTLTSTLCRHASLPNEGPEASVMIKLVYFPGWYTCHMRIPLPESLFDRVGTEHWRADLRALTRWVPGNAEGGSYLRNRYRPPEPNFSQNQKRSLRAFKRRLDQAAGRNPNVPIPVTDRNYLLPLVVGTRRRPNRQATAMSAGSAAITGVSKVNGRKVKRRARP
jgi:hypothetical protein